MPFSSAHPSLRKTLIARGYVTPTPVQAAILAPEVDVRDVLVSAQTGSGKTVAFGLALARTLLGEAERFTAAGAPRALIVTPTRELAMQVHRELSWLFADTGARITTCVGGMDPRRETYALGHGVHIVVGTPGRLCDHLARGSLVLERIAAIVLDEADEMLDMGFREDLERLLDAAPKDRRTLMFSATIPGQIAQLAKRYQRDAMRIATSAAGDRHRDIEYQVVAIVPRERDLAVVNLLRFHDPPGALVFCGTRDGVTHLAANLSERGFSVAALSGELSQRERTQALQALRDGRARVCVATDVAARGLDLPDLGLVIHADLPQNGEALVHRSGRTGRAGKKGLAIIIAVEAARRFVERLLYTARIEAKWQLPPSSDDIRDRDQDRLAGEIQALTDEVSDADRAVAQTLLANRSAEDLVAALVRLRREARPAPEELTVPPSMRQRFNADRRGPAGPGRGDRPRYDHAVRVPLPPGGPHRKGTEDRPPHPRHATPPAAATRAAATAAPPAVATAPTQAADAPHAVAAAAPAQATAAPHAVATVPAQAAAAPHAVAADAHPAAVPHAQPAAESHAVAADAPAQAAAAHPAVAADAQPATASHAAAVPHAADAPPTVAPPTAAAPVHVAATPPARAAQPARGPAAHAAAAHAAAQAAAAATAPAATEHPAPPEDEPGAGGERSKHHARADRSEPPAGARTAGRDRHSGADRPTRADRAARAERHIEVERHARTDRPERPMRSTRPDRPERHAPDDARNLVWFTINVGRSKNADPKWLIPLLCRRGGISKNAIGKIQILARETRVEIARDVSERFAAAVREPDTKDRNIHIEPVDTFAT